jgi:hypothetical protein
MAVFKTAISLSKRAATFPRPKKFFRAAAEFIEPANAFA